MWEYLFCRQLDELFLFVLLLLLKLYSMSKRFFIRNHFISNVVLDSLKFKKNLKLHGKS